MAQLGRPKGQQIVVSCFYCGKEKSMQPAVYNRNTTGRFFCSAEHRRIVGTKPVTLADRTCEQCSKQYHPRQVSNNTRFCSQVCYAEWQARNAVEKFCEKCGKSYWLSPSTDAVYRHGAKYCSRRCEADARITRGTGTYRNGVEGIYTDDGYVNAYEPTHPKANGGGRYAEHRLVMEEQLGRYLTKNEQVHHINGIKNDNRPENLKVLDAKTHTKDYTIPESGQKRKAAQERIVKLEAELDALKNKYSKYED